LCPKEHIQDQSALLCETVTPLQMHEQQTIGSDEGVDYNNDTQTRNTCTNVMIKNYRNLKQDPPGSYFCPYACSTTSFLQEGIPCGMNHQAKNLSTMFHSTCINPDLDYRVDNTEGSLRKLLTDRSNRDEMVLTDIPMNGKHPHVDILNTLIDQKITDLDAMNPAPEMYKKYMFMNHLNGIKTLIKNDFQANDEEALRSHKVTIAVLWSFYFSPKRTPKMIGQPTKDCSTLHYPRSTKDTNCGNLGIALQNSFPLTIRSSKGSTIVLLVQPSDTVVEVKAKVYKKEGIPIHHQKLIVNLATMVNEQTLQFYNVSSESIVNLIVRCREGGKYGPFGSDPITFNSSLLVPSGIKIRETKPAPLPYVLPSHPTFTPSMNGRNGWSYENIYELKQEVRTSEFAAAI
jgi:hypothetical protein